MLDYGAVMTFGGAMHIDQADRHAWIAREEEMLRELIDRGTPLLGACLGAQLLCVAAGGEVSVCGSRRSAGWRSRSSPRGRGRTRCWRRWRRAVPAFQWHSYACVPPPGSVVTARSEQCAPGLPHRRGGLGNIQFHAEVSVADANLWIDDWRSDEDAVRVGLDVERLRAETRRGDRVIRTSSGRSMASRFLEQAATRA